MITVLCFNVSKSLQLESVSKKDSHKQTIDPEYGISYFPTVSTNYLLRHIDLE